MPVNPDEFRKALGHFAATVTVVTTRVEQQLAGITVTAFSSLSLTPPLVLVCIDRKAWLHERMPVGSSLAVNFLKEDQELVSRRFASSGPNQFEGVGYKLGEFGAPLLDDCLAALECRVVDRVAGGDHTIVVAEVLATSIAEGKPLLYFRGGYNQLA